MEGQNNLHDSEMQGKVKSEKKKCLLIIALTVGIAITLVFAILALIYASSASDLSALFITFAALSFIAGIILLLVYFHSGSKRRNKKSDINITLPVVALALDLAPALFFFLTSVLSLYGVGLVLFLLSFLTPIAGIIAGIGSLILGKKHIGKSGIAISAAAIALPILFVFVMIILLSTGGAVISLM